MLNAGESQLFLSGFCGFVSGQEEQIRETTVAELCMLSVTPVEMQHSAALFLSGADASYRKSEVC